MTTRVKHTNLLSKMLCTSPSYPLAKYHPNTGHSSLNTTALNHEGHGAPHIKTFVLCSGDRDSSQGQYPTIQKLILQNYILPQVVDYIERKLQNLNL